MADAKALAKKVLEKDTAEEVHALLDAFYANAVKQD